MSWLTTALVASTLLGAQDTLDAGGVRVDGAQRPAAARTYDGSAGELRIDNPWVEVAELRIDGRLDEDIWERAAVLSGFTQYDPVEGVPASQRTEVLVLVTDDALLLGVRAYDDDPEGLRATLSERDAFDRSDDYVRFVLDTFNDQRRAYVMTVNPLGVQHDGLWVEGGGGGGRRMFGPPIDDNPDFVWESGGQIWEWGYSTEVRIPFKSLRFPEVPLQDWGFQVMRRIQRNGYQESWAPITGEVANQLAQAGKLEGLRELDPGLFLEVNPVVTGSRSGAVDEETSAFTHDPVSGDFGLNMTYGLTSNLTLDGTYNPDFSQVEADAGQIVVNERFAVFFPEKRPFFLEGTEIFQLPKNLVYTRSIVNPVGGAKLTGKIGDFNVGYLGAVDEVGEDADHPIVNLVRLRKDMGANANLGLVYTDRTLRSTDYNRVLGADGRFIFNQRYTLQFLAAGSRTARPGEELDVGSLLSARIDRASRTFSFNAEFEDITPDFLAGSGFIRRVGITQLEGRASRTWYGRRGALIEQVGPSLSLRGLWNRDDFWAGDGLLEGEAEVSLRVSFRNNFTLFGNFKREVYDFDPGEYEDLFVGDSPGNLTPFLPDPDFFGGLYGGTLGIFASGWARLRGNARITWSETPLFDRSTGVPADVANSLTIDGSVSAYPVPQLQAEIGLRHTMLDRQRDGSRYSTATIPRVRTQYQFSRFLFVRGIVEYASQGRGDLLDPATGQSIWGCSDDCTQRVGSDANDFSVEALLGYEPTPGTVFFLGYTRQMEDTGRFSFRNVTPQRDGLFLKASYRFRM